MIHYEYYKGRVNPKITVAVISLDDANKRWERLKNHLQNYGFENIVRIKAVDGRKGKTKHDIPEYKNLPCLSDGHKTHTACYLSHLKAIEYAINDSPTEWTLILEDDAVFRKNKKTVMRVLYKIMKKYELGYLTSGTAEGYIVNKEGAEKLYSYLKQDSEFTTTFREKYGCACLYDWAFVRAIKNLNYYHHRFLLTQTDDDQSYITGKVFSQNIGKKIINAILAKTYF
jgi:GR25 family glycosyltransferase involved in LPS biosynthesis